MTTYINKGSQSNEGMWEACHDVALSAGWRQGGDQFKFTTCNGVHRSAIGHANPDCESGGVIICDWCAGGKIHARQSGVGNAAINVQFMIEELYWV